MAIVKNESKGYGYTYSSLADLERAGIKIPIMRTTVNEHNGNEYVEWLDDKGEWRQGAKVVSMTMKGMNDAQAYGSALTYARRYTVQMAMSVACDDDVAVENYKPMNQGGHSSKPVARLDFNEIIEKLKAMEDIDEINSYKDECVELAKTPKQKETVEKIFAKKLGLPF
ncbi:ERF family protein [Sharpea azabuensis]